MVKEHASSLEQSVPLYIVRPRSLGEGLWCERFYPRGMSAPLRGIANVPHL